MYRFRIYLSVMDLLRFGILLSLGDEDECKVATINYFILFHTFMWDFQIIWKCDIVWKMEGKKREI